MTETKKQLVFIHGAECFSREEDYVIGLEQAEIGRDDLEKSSTLKKRWHYLPTLSDAMGSQWQVIRPDMPADGNAKYDHWKLWFEKYVPHLSDGVVLVGHSTGAMFLARYLSENDLPIEVSKLFLLAGAFTRWETGPGEEDGEYFYTHLDNFSKLEQSADQIYLLHSTDDFVVPFEHLAMWSEHLPSARVVEFTDRNHFLQETFPEIIDLIKE